MTQKRYTEIPKRQKCINKEEPYIGGAVDIVDDTLGKPQSEVNQDRIEDVATLAGKVSTEKTRAEGVEGGLNTRLQTVEQLAEISIGGGDAQIATGADFTNPDATKRAKIPTVGAIVDGLNDGIYDVTKRNPSGGPNSDGKFTLEYILSNADTLIPTGWRHGGMSIKFVHTSDNKYVQFRLMSDTFNTTVANWQGVDDGIHAGSQSLAKSGDVYDFEKVVPLTSISSTVEDNEVTKVGDIYFNSQTKRLRRCTQYNTSPTDSIYENVEKSTEKIYKVKGRLYTFLSSDSYANIQEIQSNKYASEINGENFIIELYLTGLDQSKTYIINNAGVSTEEHGYLIDAENPSTVLAYFQDTSFSKGIIPFIEYNDSGISGYIIKDFRNEGIISTTVLVNSIVSTLDESPSIKTYLTRSLMESGAIVVGNAINATNATYDSEGKFLIGERFGNGKIKEIYINKDIVGQYVTDEQLESVDKITILLGINNIYGTRLYVGDTIIFSDEYFFNEQQRQEINRSGFFMTGGIGVAFDPYIPNPTGVVSLPMGIDESFFNLNYNTLVSINISGIKPLFPTLTEGYRKLDGTIQSTQNFGYSQPIYLHAGETIYIETSVSTAVCVICSVDEDGTFKEVLVAGSSTNYDIYKYKADNDCFVSISVRTSSGSRSIIYIGKVDEDIAIVKPVMNWHEHQYITNTGVWAAYSQSFGISYPIEVFEGDVLSITAIGSPASSLFAKCRKDGSGEYSAMGYDTQLKPLVVAPDSTEREYTYTIDEHCYVVVTASLTSGEPQLYIHRKEKRNIQLQTIDDWNRTRYAEQKHYYVDKACFVPNLAKKRSNAILTYSGDDKVSSNYIANAVAYPNGEILACRKGGAVVKILNDGTEIPIQYNGADMVITNASDWRGVFMDSNENVFISPHSSMGRGSDGEIALSSRGIYRIAAGSNTATKVLALYNGPDVAPTRVTMWAENTSYTVGQIVFYLTRCYKCITAHTSGSSYDSSKFDYLNQWVANTPYAVGDMVRNGRHDFECITAHTSGSAFNAEQQYFVEAASCMEGQQDTIWTFCEDDKGNLYAGVYAHLTRRRPVIYKSYNHGRAWLYIYNFATDSDIAVQPSWAITNGPRHIHGITFNEYDNCLYCACGEVNSVFKSSDYGLTFENLKCATYHGKATAVIGVPDGIILGSDGQWECGLTKICTDGKTAKLVGQIWASFIFYIRRSDLTGWIYAFSRLDNVIKNKGNGQNCPPVEAMTDPAALQAWKESVTQTQLVNWQIHHDFCEKYYPEDAIIPHHAAIMVSKDNGDTWEMIRYEDVGTNGSSGFFTIGYFRDGECLCGLITDDGNGNIYTKPVIISEGKKKMTPNGYDLTGEIFIKTNTSNIVEY